MKREEIKKIFPDATDEQLNSIMDINGADVEKVKAKLTATEADLKESKEAFEHLNTELDELKKNNASADDWKAKFEALQAENIAKEKQAEVDRLAKEKEEHNRLMFDKALEACGKKKSDWNGKFTENGYYNEFIKALELEENTGKAHKDILHDLVKNDASAFVGVQAVQLVGGNQQGTQGNEPKPLPKIF